MHVLTEQEMDSHLPGWTTPDSLDARHETTDQEPPGWIGYGLAGFSNAGKIHASPGH